MRAWNLEGYRGTVQSMHTTIAEEREQRQIAELESHLVRIAFEVLRPKSAREGGGRTPEVATALGPEQQMLTRSSAFRTKHGP